MDDLNPKNMDVTCFKGSNKTVNTLSFNDLTEAMKDLQTGGKVLEFRKRLQEYPPVQRFEVRQCDGLYFRAFAPP